MLKINKRCASLKLDMHASCCEVEYRVVYEKCQYAGFTLLVRHVSRPGNIPLHVRYPGIRIQCTKMLGQIFLSNHTIIRPPDNGTSIRLSVFTFRRQQAVIKPIWYACNIIPCRRLFSPLLPQRYNACLPKKANPSPAYPKEMRPDTYLPYKHTPRHQACHQFL